MAAIGHRWWGRAQCLAGRSTPSAVGMAWQRNEEGRMGNVVQLPATAGQPHFVQDSQGWWWLNGHRILRVDLQTMFVHVAANCPYDVDLDLNWLHSLLHPGDEKPQPAHRKRTLRDWLRLK